LERLMTNQNKGEPALQARMELWQSYLYLLDGIPADYQVSEQVREESSKRLRDMATLNLLNEVCIAKGPVQSEAMKRLLIYLFEAPVSEETTHLFLGNRNMESNCFASLLNLGQLRMPATSYGGVGITARHPYSIPVMRPRGYPDVFGNRILPNFTHKIFSLED
jgi:hypothetical protein